jgi:hypothetical protein
MKRIQGGTKVEPGFYWNAGDWQIVTVEREPRALPGGADQSYIKVPAAGMLLLTPLLGLSFVIFLPFVGFAMVARQVGRKAVRVGALVGARLWAEPVPPAKEAPTARRRRA